MSWRIAALAMSALAGCSFSGGASVSADASAGTDGGGGDAAADAAIDAPTELAICDAPTLGACWEFENNLEDGANNNDGAGVNNPTFATAGFEGSALSLDGVDQAVLVAESDDLDAAAITVEARIRPAALPGNEQEAGIIDNQGQWSLLLFDNAGRLRCNAADGPQIDSDVGVVTTGEWIHVACTVDDQRIRLFRDGDEVACGIRDMAARTSGTLGTGVGVDLSGAGNPDSDFFEGLIDNLRVFEEARTPAQICAAAGRNGCVEITDPQSCVGDG